MRLFVIFCLLSALGCSRSLEVQSDFDSSQDFRGYKTYMWAMPTPPEKGYDNNPFDRQQKITRRVRTAVDLVLDDKGFKLIKDGTPDFRVGWHGSTIHSINVETATVYYGYGWGWYGTMGYGRTLTYASEWKQGTLVVDIIDGERNELVWRGVGVALVDADRMQPAGQDYVNQAVFEILKKFPPKS